MTSLRRWCNNNSLDLYLRNADLNLSQDAYILTKVLCGLPKPLSSKCQDSTSHSAILPFATLYCDSIAK